MSNSPILHINRLYHIEIDAILSVTQKRWGSVWIAFIDTKTNKKQIAIAKNSMSNILTIINNYKIMAGKPLFLGIIEK